MKDSRSRSTPPRFNIFVTILCATVFFSVGFFVLFFHHGYPQKIANILFPVKQITYQSTHSNIAVEAWATCLDQLNTDADIVFFGDSITRQSRFDQYFPDKIVCNLGLGSDKIAGMTERVDMITSVSPEKVFILGGINSLRDNTLDKSITEYDSLLSTVSTVNSAQIYIISVLPISARVSSEIGCKPDTILHFNSALMNLACKYGFEYINLFPALADQDGFILPELTTDGVHLTKDAYDIWAEAIKPFI